MTPENSQDTGAARAERVVHWSPARRRASGRPPPVPWPRGARRWPWWPGGADRLDEVLADCLPGVPGLTALGRRPLRPRAPRPRLALEIWDACGRLDVVVNNAGIPMRRPVTRLTMDEVEHVMTVNYFSPVAITLALLPRMLERGRGVFVNVSSLGGRLGIYHRGRLLGLQVRPGRLERGDGLPTWSAPASREARPPRGHRHRDLGPARQRRPRLPPGRSTPPRRWPPASWPPSTATASSTTCPT